MTVTAASLCREVGDTSYAKKHGLAVHIPAVWDALCTFVEDNLTAHKGVLIPGIGTFHVGSVFTPSTPNLVSKIVLPTFQMTGRFDKVSQSHGNLHRAAGRSVVQPNYHAIASAVGIDRIACQRVIKELMVQLGLHIVAGRNLSVNFGVSTLVSKGGRVQMKFSQSFFSKFSTNKPLLRPSSARPAAPPAAVPTSPPHAAAEGTESRPSTAPAGGRPQAYMGGLTGSDGRFTMLLKLCKKKDRIGTGYIAKAHVEECLRTHMRSVIANVDGMHLLDLLSTFTAGKTAKFVRYAPFVSALQEAVAASVAASPAAPAPGAAWQEEEAAPSFAGEGEQPPAEGEGGGEGEAAPPSVDSTATATMDGTVDGTAAATVDGTVEGSAVWPPAAAVSFSDAPTRSSWPHPFDASLRYKALDNQHRRENDETNRRLCASRGSMRKSFAGLAPKVGHESDARPFTPRTAQEETSLIAQFGHSPARSSHRLATTAAAAVGDVGTGAGAGASTAAAGFVCEREGEGAAAGRHRREADPSPITVAGLDMHDEILREKREATRRMLRESWEMQRAEKARLGALIKDAESHWPYAPVHVYPRPPVQSAWS